MHQFFLITFLVYTGIFRFNILFIIVVDIDDNNKNKYILRYITLCRSYRNMIYGHDRV